MHLSGKARLPGDSFVVPQTIGLMISSYVWTKQLVQDLFSKSVSRFGANS